MPRYNFIDAARGAAIVPMVINHTGHAWLIADFPGAATLFYLTEATAAPLFLFIAGFSLVLSWSRAKAVNRLGRTWLTGTILRAIFLIVVGYFLNLLLFPGHVLFLMGPLQTIGLSTLLLIPLLPWLTQRWLRYLLVGMTVISFAILAWQAQALAQSILFHPAWGEMLFFSLPPWPWMAMVVLGALLGSSWCEATTKHAQQKILNIAARWGGILFLAGWVGVLFLGWHDYSITFSRYITWLPGSGTALWMTGFIPLLLLVAYHLEEWQKLPQWLLNVGRNALLIYVIHRLFIILIMTNIFHLTVGSISGFIVVNLALLFALNEIAKLINQLRAFRFNNSQTETA